MGVITLLTDFGLHDEFVGVMHGVILGIHPAAKVVDLCHAVPPGDRRRAALLLAWSWRYFPPGTVHVTVVDPGVGTTRRILYARVAGHHFLAPDNGVLTGVLSSSTPTELREVRERRYWLPSVNPTFHGRDIFAPVAARLSKGLRPALLGPKTTRWVRLPIQSPRRVGRQLVGQVIDVDRFGNLVTNLDRASLGKWPAGALMFRIRGRRIRGLVRTFWAVRSGALAAVVGSRGLVEIAIRDGDASRTLRAAIGTPVIACHSVSQPLQLLYL